MAIDPSPGSSQAARLPAASRPHDEAPSTDLLPARSRDHHQGPPPAGGADRGMTWGMKRRRLATSGVAGASPGVAAEAGDAPSRRSSEPS